MFPRVVIDLNKIEHNLDVITEKVNRAGCSIGIVTKVVCADSKITNLINKKPQVRFFADSRIENLINIGNTNKEKILLRLPMISDVDRIVLNADISLNSELCTIKKLNEAAEKIGKIHKIVLMIDLGDLREGIYYTNEDEIFSTVENILKLNNIKLYGIGVNLTCYGAIIPQNKNLSRLVEISQKIKDKFNIDFEIISGGNSSSLHLIDKGQLPKGINNLRIGEAFFLANETAYSTLIPNMYDDAITLEAEIIEIKTKPSMPVGEIGVDAFGKKPFYEDKGNIKRAIIAIGKQDVDIEGIKPVDSNIDILGGSSDHTILDLSKTTTEYKVGDIVKFKLTYSSLLKVFTSKYVNRMYI